jgi:UDP-N-acetylglucosamine transferase subunit ALG13
MIFVTVGNQHTRFMRLLTGVDRLAGEGVFGGEPVVIQSGHNPDFHPQYCIAQAFFNMDEFHQKVREASAVVCHAGAGTLSAVLRTGKTPVVVPRRLKYNEILDDHQLELLDAFAARGLVVAALEIESLAEALREAKSRPAVSVDSVHQAIEKIGRAVEELLGVPDGK